MKLKMLDSNPEIAPPDPASFDSKEQLLTTTVEFSTQNAPPTPLGVEERDIEAPALLHVNDVLRIIISVINKRGLRL